MSTLDQELKRISGLDERMQVVEDGKVMCSVGLLATLYFLNGGDPHVRLTMFHGGKKKDDASLYTAQILSRADRPIQLS